MSRSRRLGCGSSSGKGQAGVPSATLRKRPFGCLSWRAWRLSLLLGRAPNRVGAPPQGQRRAPGGPVLLGPGLRCTLRPRGTGLAASLPEETWELATQFLLGLLLGRRAIRVHVPPGTRRPRCLPLLGSLSHRPGCLPLRGNLTRWSLPALVGSTVTFGSCPYFLGWSMFLWPTEGSFRGGVLSFYASEAKPKP